MHVTLISEHARDGVKREFNEHDIKLAIGLLLKFITTAVSHFLEKNIMQKEVFKNLFLMLQKDTSKIIVHNFARCMPNKKLFYTLTSVEYESMTI